jgi:hypothetical protein
MLRRHRWKGVLALAGALSLLMTSAAYATLTWTLSDYTHDAYADSTTDIVYGSFIATDSLTIMPAGWGVAEANDLTSPVQPPPQNGDTVATGTVTAKWTALFCATSTLSFTGKWVEPIDSGAPANSVGEINMTTSIFSTKVYILKVNGVYEFDTPSMPSGNICTSTTAGEWVTKILGTVAGATRHVIRNPHTPGVYTMTVTWHDGGGGTHTETASVTIV